MCWMGKTVKGCFDDTFAFTMEWLSRETPVERGGDPGDQPFTIGRDVTTQDLLRVGHVDKLEGR